MATITSKAESPLVYDAADISMLIGIGQRTLWRWIATGVFPKPDIRIGKRIVKWRRETVLAWLDQRTTDSRA